MTVPAVKAASPRRWAGLVTVYLSIPLVLLVCGGDPGWWQAWVYSLPIFAAGVGGRVRAERRHPGLMAERQNIEKIQSSKSWDKLLAPLMALSLSFPLVIVAGLDHRFGGAPEISPWRSKDSPWPCSYVRRILPRKPCNPASLLSTPKTCPKTGMDQ